ncbi:hypothetical protein QQ045_024743 [Rhodiola kirilowii]
MSSMGFHALFIKWVMACVTSARFSLLMNGNLIDYFASNRGLRQGDPLFPFLFTLVMEVLARRLQNLKNDKGFAFHPKCKKISLTHLMFADDLLIMSKANVDSVSCIKKDLDDFYSWSGLSVSSEKSCIFFGGSPNEEKVLVASVGNFSVGSLPFMYLGIPMERHGLKKRHFGQIIDKVTAKISSWIAKCLSYAGRLVLVKHVL